MGEDILSVVFLAFICIVVAAIAGHLAPDGMQMPTFALIAVCLWIAYDYILLHRYKAKKACAAARGQPIDEDAEMDRRIKALAEELNDDSVDKLDEVNDLAADAPEHTVEEEKPINEFPIEQVHKSMGSSGDNQIANRMKYMGLQARMSQDIRAKWNAEKFRPYFEEELRQGENRDWWDVEADYLDDFM